MDALTLLAGVLLSLSLWRLACKPAPLAQAWIAVVVLTTASAISTVDRDVAFFRLLLLGGAWLVHALSYRYHTHIARALPYAAGAVLAISLGALLVFGYPIGWLWDHNITADVLLLLTPWLRGPVMMALGLVLLALTGSRGAWMGLAAALLWLIARPRWYVWALAVGTLAVGLVFIRPATAQIRVDIWLDALRMIVARPLTGWGLGATVAGGHPHAHNIVLDAWVNGGPLLAAAWSLFLYSVIRLIVGPPGSRARLGLLAVILHGLVDCEVFTPVLLIAAVNLALLVRYRESENVFSEWTHHSSAAASDVTAAA